MIKIGRTGPVVCWLSVLCLAQNPGNVGFGAASPPPISQVQRDSVALPAVPDTSKGLVPALVRTDSLAGMGKDSSKVRDNPKVPDSAKPVDSTVRRGPQVSLVVRGLAPLGSQVTLNGGMASMDSLGKYRVQLVTDSLTRLSQGYDLCLNHQGQVLCTVIHPQGYDTLDVAPLEIKVDSVVETRDTIRTIVDTTKFDSAALVSKEGPKVVQSSAGRTVTIKGKRRPPRVLGQERVTIQTIKRLPTLAEPDVMRAVQALPGVVQSSDFSTKIYVRGSSSDENLILFDNGVVYSPAHFGGLFSTFLADVTGGLDFYKGGFDPRYGNRLASVLLVSSKVGGTDRDSARDSTSLYRKYFDKGLRGTESLVTRSSSDSLPKAKTQGSFRFSTFGGTLATDGVQGDASWALAGRRTWIGTALDVARRMKWTDIQLDYDFYDWQGSGAWGHNGDTVRASIYQGRDGLSFDPFNVGWGNLVVPVNVRWKLGDRLTFFGAASYSKFDQDFSFAPVLDIYNAVGTWAGRGELRYDVGDGHLASLGSEYNTYHSNFTFINQKTSSTQASITDADLWAGWLQDRWVINPQHTVIAGLRGYWYGKTEDASFDPRISYTYRPNSDWKFDAHWGHYSQYMTSLRFADMEFPNEFWYADQKPMVPTTQNMTSLGVERLQFTSLNLHASLEGYYKDLHDMPLFFPNATSAQSAADKAAGYDEIASSFSWLDGYSIGSEVSVGKDDGWWTGNVSYSYSQAVLHQQPYTNSLGTTNFDPYYADWDQPQAFKVSGALNWIGRKADEALSVKKMWAGDYYRSSFQFTATSGVPYTDYLGYEKTDEPFQNQVGKNGGGGGPSAGSQSVYVNNNTVLVKGPRNGARKPAYIRLDITPIDWGRTGHWRFYYTIINVLDRQNLYLVNYNTRDNPPSKREIFQFPRLPFFFGYEYQF